MQFPRWSLLRAGAGVLTVALLAGCASSRYQAPVEDRSVAGARASAPGDVAKPPPPGIENAGKPGYYTIKQGDTLIRIGLESGQNWRDIQKWNNLDNPNVLEVGQVVRVVPPGLDAAAAAPKPIGSTKVEARGLDVKPTEAAAATGAAASTATAEAAKASAPSAVTTATTPPAATPAPPASTGSGDDAVNWMWPAQGAVLAGFDEARNKGLSIAGKAGDPVLASADGRVVYAGSGLRGYGNLVIIKHNDTYLSAYAHNQALMVKEDQPVRRGQKIAEMGNTDADKVHLHFEIRRKGKPVDPAKILPGR